MFLIDIIYNQIFPANLILIIVLYIVRFRKLMQRLLKIFLTGSWIRSCYTLHRCLHSTELRRTEVC